MKTNNNFHFIFIFVFGTCTLLQAMQEQELRPASPRQLKTLQWIHVINEAEQQEEYSTDIESFFKERTEENSDLFGPTFMSITIRKEVEKLAGNQSQETEKICEKLTDYCTLVYHEKLEKEQLIELKRTQERLNDCKAKLPPKTRQSDLTTPC